MQHAIAKDLASHAFARQWRIRRSGIRDTARTSVGDAVAERTPHSSRRQALLMCDYALDRVVAPSRSIIACAYDTALRAAHLLHLLCATCALRVFAASLPTPSLLMLIFASVYTSTQRAARRYARLTLAQLLAGREALYTQQLLTSSQVCCGYSAAAVFASLGLGRRRCDTFRCTAVV